MKRMLLTGAVSVLAIAAVIMAGAEPIGLGQVSKGKSRPAATKYLMRGGVQTHCAGIGGLLKKGPADDKGWDTLACHAAVLNELSFILMEDGRCPDKTWAEAAKTLREGSDKVLTAAREKKLDDAQAAFKIVTSACASCHGAHKSKK